MRRKRLETLGDLRRFMSSVIAKLEKEQISPELAGRLGYLCNIQKSIIESSSLEERLSKLEETIKNEHKGKNY